MAVRVVATLDVFGGIEFVSEPMSEDVADIVLRELSRGTRLTKARIRREDVDGRGHTHRGRVRRAP